MKSAKYIISLLMISVLFILSSCSSGAKAAKGKKTYVPVTIARILDNASMVLNREQAKRLKAFNPALGQKEYFEIYNVFDDLQKKALKEALGVIPPKKSFPEETPRALFLIIILENYRCPLSQQQLDKIKSLPASEVSSMDLKSILTVTQKNAMRMSFGR